MKRAIREHLRDFVAIVGLVAIAAAVTAVILERQGFTLPSWVPVLGHDAYQFKGEFSTAQAVTPGQGQTVNVAGVRVGEITRVDLRDGRAVVSMQLDDDADVTVRRDARMLLRPKTGLKDMIVELDPGSRGAARLPDGGTVPVAATQPDVNLDELLSSLDADTRSYLQLLLSGGGEGLANRGADLGDTLRTFEPTAHALRRINTALAERRRNVRRVMHNFALLADELGDRDELLARFVNDSNAVLGTFAQQESSLRATVRELPDALSESRRALGRTSEFAAELGPALGDLRPAARALAPALRQVRPFLRDSTPVIRDSVRPLVREARPLVAELRPALRDLGAATPDLGSSLRIVNLVLDALAHNPDGVEEGYLFWLAWTNHLGASIFSTQDAHGPVRRGLLLTSCDGLRILDNLKQVNKVLGTIIELSNFPKTQAVCPAGASPFRRSADPAGAGRSGAAAEATPQPADAGPELTAALPAGGTR